LYNVIRAQKEINGGKQGIGFMGTSVTRFLDGLAILGSDDKDHNLHDILSDRATTFGIDGWTFLGPNDDWAIGAWFGATQVSGSKERMLSLQENSRHYFQRPDVDHIKLDKDLTILNGYAGRIKVNKETGNVKVNAAFGIVSPGFESNDLGYQGKTDVINNHVGIGYNWTEPGKYIRNMRSDIFYGSNHDLSGTKIGERLLWMGHVSFLNYWSAHWETYQDLETSSNIALRGGPRVIEPASWNISNSGFHSNSRKDITFGAHINYSSDKTGSNDRSFDLELDTKINDRFNIRFSPSIRHNINTDQYITSVIDANNVEMYGKRYIVGELDQMTFSANIRVNYTFTPRLTLQSYFQPFISAGSYSGFKEFIKPESYDFLEYGENNSTIKEIDDNYVIDPTGGDSNDAFTISNPNFSYKALVGTLVLRWEFSPGSALFFVWTHNGTNVENPGDFQLGRDLGDLLNAKADDIFAVKLSYWIGK
jgi:hypothetical protein